MTKIRVFIFIIILVLLAGCSRTTQVKHETVTSLNDKIIEEFQEVSSIKASIMRPTLTWDITLTDPSSCDKLFVDLLSMIKSEDVYSLLREYYKDYFTHIGINIQNENSELIKKYTSSYYKSGTTIYNDDSKNEIDDFNTWYIEDFVQVGSDIYIYDESDEIDHSYESLVIGYWYLDEIGIYTGEYNTQDEQEISKVITMLESSTIIKADNEIDIGDNMAWLSFTYQDNSLFIGVMESGVAKVDNEYFIKLSEELLSYLDKHNLYEAVREVD